MRRFRDRDGFLEMPRIERGPWQALERAVARMFVHQGWPDVSIVGGTGDMGADVIVSDGNEEMVAQVKYKSDSDRPARKQIVSDVKRAMDFYQMSRGLAVTNTRLSSGANEFLDRLQNSGYDIEKLEGADLLGIYEQLDTWSAHDHPPYDYQEPAIKGLEERYKQGYDCALLALATGLGKTFVTGRFLQRVITDEPSVQVLVLANQRSLIRQFEEEIWEHLPKQISTHLWYGNEEPAYGDGIIIATFQTVRNVSQHDLAGRFDIVIVDEAHHAPASSYRGVIEKIDPEFLLGLTATPWRDDSLSMRELFGEPEPELTIDVVEALDKGYLTDVDYRLYCDNIDWEQVQEMSRQNYSIKDINKRLFIAERDDEAVSEISRIWGETGAERGIVYCASIKHAKRMSTFLRERGFGAKSFHSNIGDEREEEARLRSFRRGDLDFITAVDKLNEGVDVPEVDLIVFLRVTHSRRIFLQQLGRGLRLAPGKEKVVVMDMVADIRRIAEAVDIDRDLKKGEDLEVLQAGFNLSFTGNRARDFFTEYLADKAQISTKAQEEQLKFP